MKNIINSLFLALISLSLAAAHVELPKAGQEPDYLTYLRSSWQSFPAPVLVEKVTQVFTTNPQSLMSLPYGQPEAIAHTPDNHKEPLKKFFFEHTRGFQEIPKTNTSLTADTILDVDVHNRPARKHQVKQILEYIIAREKGVKYMTFAAATGSGKSNTMLRLAELIRPKKVLLVTPRENLITQIIEESRKHYPHLKISGSNESDHKILDFLRKNVRHNDITVTSLQGFQRASVHKNTSLLSKIDVVIFDEAHNLFSEKRKELVDYLKSFDNHKLELLFFTATPTLLVEHNKTNLKSTYQLSNENDASHYHITPFSIFDAIDAKVNVPFQITNVIDLPPLQETFESIHGEYNESQVDRLLAENSDHLGVVLDIYQNGSYYHPEQGHRNIFGEFAMAFCAGIAHAEKLVSFLNNHFKELTRTDDVGIWHALKAEYEKNVHEYFKSAHLADNDSLSSRMAADFLAENPFVFADAVHTGNKDYPLKADEARNRLLRNRLGGSLFLAGATKLMEGFDNPRIKVLFNLKPVRQSNTRLVQGLGRVLRADSANPSSIAKVFEFVFDKKQLLTSSPQVLGVMNYGIAPGHELKVHVLKQNPGTSSYKLSQQPLSQNDTKRAKKRAIPEQRDPEHPPKKLRVSASPANLESQLKKLIEDLSQKVSIVDRLGDEDWIVYDDKSMAHTPTRSVSKKRTSAKNNDKKVSPQSKLPYQTDPARISMLLEEAKLLFEDVKQLFEHDYDELLELTKQFSFIEQQIGHPEVNPENSAVSSSTFKNEPYQFNIPPPIILTTSNPASTQIHSSQYQLFNNSQWPIPQGSTDGFVMHREHGQLAEMPWQGSAYNNNYISHNEPSFSASTYADAAANQLALNNFQQAADLYDAALQMDPNAPAYVYADAAYANRMLKRNQRSAQLYNITLQIDPNAPAHIYTDAAFMNGKINNWRLTVEQYEIARQIDPNFDANNYNNLAHAYARLGNWHQSLRYGLIAKTKGTACVSFNLGVAYLQLGKTEEGIKYIKEFIDSSSALRLGRQVLKGKPIEILEHAFSGLPDTKYCTWLLQQKAIIESMN